ncbi:hypothetical protein [Alterisphingorhabdus coralli]|uniref:Uncharacterized protein n=1 Tax=Alterisphingorhabdus coralli TaxID=3071408 RepID=A0AA97I2N7_9SPHN|nr:hypothetical protein [Parasphingorhabdus sp. SCSIO 66989]WOE76443.1 hypothetical protein RB602_06940 [Parasphingorhabdus sp. SCSIO 66989]
MKEVALKVTAILLLLFAHTAHAQEKSAVKEDFAFPSDGSAIILVFRPDISVGRQSTGGVNEPSVEWTETARRLLTNELINADVTKQHQFVFLPEYQGAEGELINDYQNLFQAVTFSVVQHKLFSGNRLPTKKRMSSLDWSLGEGTQQLADLGGGDYALFFYTYDSYGSAGRKAAQAVGMLGCIIGVCVPISAGVHTGYAGLVDLKTGDLVWVNADLEMGGDVRELEGAQKRVAQLLEDFPLPAPGTEGDVTVIDPITGQRVPYDPAVHDSMIGIDPVKGGDSVGSEDATEKLEDATVSDIEEPIATPAPESAAEPAGEIGSDGTNDN